MKILFLGANSLDTPQLQIPAELRDVKEEFERAAKRQDIDVRAELAVRPTDLSRLLLDYRPDIVHFSGHGMELRVRTRTTTGTTREFDLPDDSASQDKSAESAILFVSSAGHAVLVPPDALTSLFGILKTQRCIVLNACFSAAQARALSQHVDCVVGMTRTIRDESAIAFAAGFYQALARGKSVKEALELGKNLIAICSLPDAEVPELYTKNGIDADAVRFVQVESALERAPFIVPFPQDKRFLGRDDDLKKLHALLEADAAIGVGAVTGMGGIGKTQLAVEYAYRYRAAYPDGVYWLNAARDWQDEFARLAGKVGIRDQSASEYERLRWLARAFVEYLEKKPKSLLIFDNVEDPLELQNRSREFVPADLPCKLLFTTRRQTDAFPMVEIRSLDDDSALRLLLDTPTRKQLLHNGSAEDQSTARSICRTLGNLPLAIALASAYLEKRPHVPLQAYLEGLVKDGALPVMDGAKVDPRQLPTQHAQGLRATLQEQWSALRDDGDARAVLQTAALLGEAEQIPRARLSLLTGLADEHADWRDPPLDEALRELSEWSLVETLSESAIRLHPLVREFAVGKFGASRQTFASACAGRMADALYDMERLSHEVERRGIDAVLADVRAGVLLYEHDEQRRLKTLQRPLDREAHLLRRRNLREMPPGFFLQQLRNRSFELSIEAVWRPAAERLIQKKHSWLRERFVVETESNALVRTLVGHTDYIYEVALTSDGRFIVSGSYDGTCKLWDFHDGRCIRTFAGHTDTVTGIAVSSHGRVAVSASNDRTLRVWDIETGVTIRVLKGHSDAVMSVIIPPNDRLIASTSADCTTKIWDFQTGALVRTLKGHGDWITIAAITPDQRFLISASADQRLKLWNLASGDCIREFVGRHGSVRTVAIAPDGRHFVSGHGNGAVIAWEIETGRILFDTLHPRTITSIAITPDGRRVVVGSYDGNVRILDFETGRTVGVFQGHSGCVLAVVLTRNGRFAVSASNDRTLKVWDLEMANANQNAVIAERHTAAINSVAFSPDGQFAVTGSNDSTVKLWHLSSGRVAHTQGSHRGPVNAVAITPDGQLGVSGSNDCLIRIWELETGNLVKGLQAQFRVVDVAITPDGRRAISASGSGILAVWDMVTGAEQYGYDANVTRVVAMPNGRHAMCVHRTSPSCWDLEKKNGYLLGIGIIAPMPSPWPPTETPSFQVRLMVVSRCIISTQNKPFAHSRGTRTR